MASNAAIRFVMTENHLHERQMRKRSEDKLALFRKWHAEQGQQGDERE
jgi:hypothetical protein